MTRLLWYSLTYHNPVKWIFLLNVDGQTVILPSFKSIILNLKNIDLKIKRGEFVTVVGDVGSGKSSLLSAINGDMLFVPQDYVSLECTLVA